MISSHLNLILRIMSLILSTVLTFSLNTVDAKLVCQDQFLSHSVGLNSNIELELGELLELNPQANAQANEYLKTLKPLTRQIPGAFGYKLFSKTAEMEALSQDQLLSLANGDHHSHRDFAAKMLELLIKEFLPSSEIIHGPIPTYPPGFSKMRDAQQREVLKEYKALLKKLTEDFEIKSPVVIGRKTITAKIRRALDLASKNDGIKETIVDMLATTVPFMAQLKVTTNKMVAQRDQTYETIKDIEESAQWWFRNWLTIHAGTFFVLGGLLGMTASGGTINGAAFMAILMGGFTGPLIIGSIQQSIFDSKMNKALGPLQKDAKQIERDPNRLLRLNRSMTNAKLSLTVYSSNQTVLEKLNTEDKTPSFVISPEAKAQFKDQESISEAIESLDSAFITLLNISTLATTLKGRIVEVQNYAKLPDNDQTFKRLLLEAQSIDQRVLKRVVDDLNSLLVKLRALEEQWNDVFSLHEDTNPLNPEAKSLDNEFRKNLEELSVKTEELRDIFLNDDGTPIDLKDVPTIELIF